MIVLFQFLQVSFVYIHLFCQSFRSFSLSIVLFFGSPIEAISECCGKSVYLVGRMRWLQRLNIAYVHTHTHVQEGRHTQTHAHAHAHAHANANAHASTRMHAYAHAHAPTRTHTHTHTHTHAHTHTRTHAHTHTRTHAHGKFSMKRNGPTPRREHESTKDRCTAVRAVKVPDNAATDQTCRACNPATNTCPCVAWE